MGSDAANLPEGYRRQLAARHQRVDALRAELRRCFPKPAPLTLEIGCGHGHYLAAYAASRPAEQCLGIDLITRRVQRAWRKRERLGLANLHFLKAEARECLEALPPWLPLHRVFLLFPDPWPKRRHHKNRILQPAFLEELAKHAVAGTLLHFRTDHEENFAWGMDVLASDHRWTIDDGADWPLEVTTFFQRLADAYFSLTAVFCPEESAPEAGGDA